MRSALQIIILGLAIFSMFFGGGNLTFPLWVGSGTSSVLLSSIGFIFTGVLLPFFGIFISLYFQGEYKRYLNACGKTVGNVLVFALLLFWIPLGSGPRCNQLAYGAFCSQFGSQMPLWLYSAIYTCFVYLLTFRENRVIEILGKVLTPFLVFGLFFLIFSIFSAFSEDLTPVIGAPWESLGEAFFMGYQTMDFIAAIFFSSTVISLLKSKEQGQFNFSLVKNACVFAIILLSLIYIGLIFVGYANQDFLINVPRDRLLAEIGQKMFSENFQIIVFMIINLSVLSTSIALSLVFSDYLRQTLLNNKLSHPFCLFISVVISYIMSIIGFESLATLISFATSLLYPALLFISVFAFAKNYYQNKRTAAQEDVNQRIVVQDATF